MSDIDLKSTRRKKASSFAGIDRLPPHSIEAEQGVLSCQLIDPAGCILEVAEKFKGKCAHYYDLRHQMIQQAIFEMHKAGEAVDLITLSQHLKDNHILEKVAGIAYLNQLQESAPSAANLSYYLEIVDEKYLLRRMMIACSETIGKMYDHEGNIESLFDEVEKSILSIGQSRETTVQPSIKELVRNSITNIEKMWQRKGELSGISTGFPDLDEMTDGMHNGEMIVYAARPSMGKTSLAMNIAEHVAVNLNLPVGVFSLEMTADSLTTRTLASMARVNLRTIRRGYMADTDFPKLTNASSKLSASPLHIDDTAGLSILQLRARARRMKQQFGIKLFVIDYLQLLNAAGKRSEENRQQEIADISSGIKSMAKELNVPVIVLAQMNRDIEKEKNRKPRMSDLRESGAIEQDADLLGLLYREQKDEEEQDGDAITISMVIAKQRNGPTGDVHFSFLKPYTRFESMAKYAPEDVPSGNNPHND